jgi:putative ABC transport system ATP-binding protein
MMLLEVKNVSKSYKAGISALESTSFNVMGTFNACLTGPSGSGKSTLLNIISGLLPPSSGEVFFDGASLATLDDAALSRFRCENIGCVPQGRSMLASLTVLENVCLPFYLAKKKGDPKDRATELLALMGLDGFSNRRPKELSGGELRRAAIARGLMNQPKLLVADEPTSDLDPANAEAVMALFAKAIDAGVSVLLATHDMNCLKHCSIHLTMEKGRLLA